MISRLPEIKKAVDQINRGELSSRELVEFCLARIDRFERQVKAWERVDAEGARREAQRLDELAKSGKRAGILHGIPVGIKDIVDVAGWPTKAGSPLRAEHIAERDADVVRSLRQAGAIVLGKTVTTQLAYFDPPQTCNPWDLDRTPGGSSSGSAAAVVMEMCMAAVGSQTGGSIIRPASYCGVCGLKPTFDVISLAGVVPVSPRLDHLGPIARTTDDLATMLHAMADPGRLTRMREIAADDAARAGTSVGEANSRRPPRLMQLTGSWLSRVTDEVATVTADAIERLAQSVAWHEPATLPPLLDNVHEHHLRIMSVEAAVAHRAAFIENTSEFRPQISGLITQGLATRAVDFSESLRLQQEMRDEIDRFFERHGAIAVTPATTTTAPNPSTTGDPSFNSPWSLLGLPTVTIPCGLADGLPCGLQFIAARDHDHALLDAARWCEEFLGFVERPPLLA